MTRNKLLSIDVKDVSEEEIDAHFHLLPDSYFVTTSDQEIERHLRMVNRLLYEINRSSSIGSLKPIIEWSPDIETGISAVTVVTWDRAGLFHKLAGALNIAGYNILGATAMSRSDNIAIDTFHVAEKGPRHMADSERVFEESLSNTLQANENLYPKIKDIFSFQNSNLPREPQNAIAHAFHTKAEIYPSLSNKSAIIETQAPDTPGLLYQIAHVLHEQGFDITTANITTKQGFAIDSLNFKSAIPNRVLERQKLLELQVQIEKLLRDVNPFAALS